jgi:hypothetical protein
MPSPSHHRIVVDAAGDVLERRDPPRGYFNRMADPEGNEFCLGSVVPGRLHRHPGQFTTGRP